MGVAVLFHRHSSDTFELNVPLDLTQAVASRNAKEHIMSLLNCPECSREISDAAEACPQCGYPMRAAAPAGPKCYACELAATSRCQCCGAMSCVEHLQSIYVRHYKGGAYELRCVKCHTSADRSKMIGFLISSFLIVIVLIVLISSLANSSRGPFGP